MSSGVHRFLVTAPLGDRMDVWAATGTVANWIEGRGPAERETWLVTCMGEHAGFFLEVARKRDVTVEEIEGAGDDERYVLRAGEPGTGWKPGGDGKEAPAGPCPGGCGCRLGTDDADRSECGCDGGCCGE